MLRELMEKVSERNIRIASPGDHGHIGHSHTGHNHAGPLPPAVTIIKKNNTTKFLVEPMLSPPTSVEQTALASSIPAAVMVGDCRLEASPFGNPLCASTPQNAAEHLSSPGKLIVLCDNSKFRIESNSYFSIRFETSTIIRHFQILNVTNFLLI